MTGRTCLRRDRKRRSSHQTLGPGGVTESRPCHIWFGFGPRHCLFLPSCLQRGQCLEQSNEKLIYVMKSLTVILLTLSSLGQEIYHMPTEWPPWCCQSDEASLNFRLYTLDQPNPVWSLSFFYYGPSWHNQRNRRYHVVSPVKVMAHMAFSSSGWCNESYLIAWLLFTSPSVSFSSSGYKRPAVRTEFWKWFNLCINKIKVGSNYHVCKSAPNRFRNFRNKLLSAETSTSDWCVCLFVCCWLWPERPSFPTFDVRPVWFEGGAQARLNIPADLSLIRLYYSLVLSNGEKQNHN